MVQQFKQTFFSPAPVSDSIFRNIPKRRRFRLIDELLRRFFQLLMPPTGQLIIRPVMVSAQRPQASHRTY